MYSPTFWSHVRHPRNNRAFTDAQTGEARYHRCGDRLTLDLRIQDDRIIEASFQARACAPVIAAASLGTEMLRGMELEAARRLDIFQMDRELGGLPPSKRHAYLIFLECLQKALEPKF